MRLLHMHARVTVGNRDKGAKNADSDADSGDRARQMVDLALGVVDFPACSCGLSFGGVGGWGLGDLVRRGFAG